MKRRSFISLMGIAPLLRMPLWGQDQEAAASVAWGPPVITDARGEHQRVVLSFTPVAEATAYQLRYRSSAGEQNSIPCVLVTNYCVHGLKNGTKYWFSLAAVGPRGITPYSEEMTATPGMEMDWPTLTRAFSGAHPTRSSCPFLSIHGNESDESLRQFMALIHRLGFEGVTLHPYDMEGYLEEGMWRRWRVILDQALKFGLTVWQQDDRDYPSGYAGGKIVAQDRKLGRWVVSLPYRKVHRGPAALSLQLKEVLPAPQQLVAISAFGPENRVEDLTARVSGGLLRWDVPEGDWQVCVMGAWQPELDTPQLVRGSIRGYIDPLSPQATDLYIKTIYEATAHELGAEFGRHWKGWFIDEPGFYSSGARLGELEHDYPYTPDFAARFEQHYRYSPLPLLPLLWVAHGPMTTRLRHDYMDFVSNEYNRLYLGKIREFCESRGMMMIGHVREDAGHEMGPGTGSDFRSLETYSIGAFDHIFVQWYAPDDDCYWRHSKMASSISHYRQVPLDEALVETFALTGWQTGLTQMKAMVDWTTTRGLNRIVPAGLDTGATPTWEFCPEFWLHGANPLTPYFPALQVIVNRETMMIRGGRHVAKALILDPAESDWVGPADDLWRANKAFSQAHFDYDNVSCRVFADPVSCRIEGKQFRLGQEEYDVVVLPSAEAVPVEVLRRLFEFYEAGGTVICLGASMRLSYDSDFSHVDVTNDLPVRSADGRADGEVKSLVARIWGDRASGRGQAYSTTYKSVKDLLYSFNTHDVWIDPNLDMLQYYHRRLASRDLYFFNNEGADVRTVVRLRGAKGVPELWDPVTGTILQAPFYEANEEGIQLWLALARYESLFVVLNPTARPQPHLADTNADEVARTTDGRLVLKKFAAGSVYFRELEPDGRSMEKQFVTAPGRLTRQTVQQGWERTPIEPNGATYQAKFDWTPQTGVSAELVVTDMSQVIHVRLNGKELGMRFTYPYRFELGPALQAGENELELKHIERYTFTSKLGTVRIVPYYLFRI